MGLRGKVYDTNTNEGVPVRQQTTLRHNELGSILVQLVEYINNLCEKYSAPFEKLIPQDLTPSKEDCYNFPLLNPDTVPPRILQCLFCQLKLLNLMVDTTLFLVDLRPDTKPEEHFTVDIDDIIMRGETYWNTNRSTIRRSLLAIKQLIFTSVKTSFFDTTYEHIRTTKAKDMKIKLKRRVDPSAGTYLHVFPFMWFKSLSVNYITGTEQTVFHQMYFALWVRCFNYSFRSCGKYAFSQEH